MAAVFPEALVIQVTMGPGTWPLDVNRVVQDWMSSSLYPGIKASRR